MPLVASLSRSHHAPIGRPFALATLLALVLTLLALPGSPPTANAHPGPADIVDAQASDADRSNVAANTIDGDPGTRWSAAGRAEGDGDAGPWIVWSLDDVYELSRVEIAFYQGDNGNRQSFHLEVSTDGESWDRVLSARSTGATLDPESFEFEPVRASYVRYVGEGRDRSVWNSLTTVDAHGVPAEADSEPDDDEFDWCLTVETVGEGAVELEPEGPCFDGEVDVAATAVAADGWAFSHWEGDDSGSQNPVSGPIEEDWTTVAVFVEQDAQDGESSQPAPSPSPDGDVAASELDESTTGYRAAGLALSDLRSSGSITTSSHGQVIDGMDVSGQIRVQHRDVTIRNSRVRHSGGYGISIVHGADVGTVTVENVEVDGQGVADGIGIYVTAPVEVTRARIHGQRVGMQVSSGSTVQQSYIHDQAVASGTHNTAMSSHGASGLVIRDNRLESSTSASLSLYPRLAPIQNALVTGNLFEGNGRGIGLYAGYTSNHPYRDQNRDIRIEGNRWTGSFQHGTHLAYNPDQPGNTWRDNAWLDGTPIG